MFIRGHLLFRTSVQPSYFQILNISNPDSIYEVGRIDGYGGHALYADDYFAYLSCTDDHEGLFVIDITNPVNPQLRDSLNPEGLEKWGSYMPVPLSYGYLASDYGGLVTVDMHNVNSISEAWSGYKADQSIDVTVDGQRAYVANECSGMQILDVGDPTEPVSLGIYDTTGAIVTYCATALDSFAFIGRSSPYGRQALRVLDVLDPSNPTVVAQESCYNPPKDYALKDSLLYAAEEGKFQVFSIARPREPILAGSCGSQGGVYFGLAVQDTLAYLISGALEVVDVADPASPTIIGTTGVFGNGVAVRDTFVYVPYGYDTLRVYSAANPRSLRQIGFAPLQSQTSDVALAESVAVVSTVNGLEALSLEDPAHPHWRAGVSTPYYPLRVVYSAPYFYAAMEEGGLGIYSTESLGVQEQAPPVIRRAQLVVWPNPVRDRCVMRLDGLNGSRTRLCDVSGRVMAVHIHVEADKQLQLDLAKLASGVYFVEVYSNRRIGSVKLVKQ